MSENRILAERLVDKLRPRLVDLLADLLDDERGAEGAEEAMPHRLPGVSEESYQKAAAAVARWGSGRSRGKVRKAG